MPEKKRKEVKMEADEIEVQESIKISDGVHTGIIANVTHEKRGDEGQYDYIDIYIDTNDDNSVLVTLKTGFPAYLSDSSGLGRMLKDSGMPLKVGAKVSVTEMKDQLIGKKVVFQTMTEDKFARIIKGTIKFV